MVHLAEKCDDLTKELESIQAKLNESKASSTIKSTDSVAQFKKPVTTVTIKSKSEYSAKFYSTISQNLKIKANTPKESELLHLTRLVINNCDLKTIHASIFDLKLLTHLDMSNNKLTQLDDFKLFPLVELNLAQNDIKTIGQNIYLPRLISLDLSYNKLEFVSKRFCEKFANISLLRLNNNQIRRVYVNFGYFMKNLIHLYGSHNRFDQLPYSFSHLRLETLELNDNPLTSYSPLVYNGTNGKFPTLVELSARAIINRK